MTMRRMHCARCNYVFDETMGDPEDGIVAGTQWEDIPEAWACPNCSAGKEEFREET